jgi:hypothetical protein
MLVPFRIAPAQPAGQKPWPYSQHVPEVMLCKADKFKSLRENGEQAPNDTMGWGGNFGFLPDRANLMKTLEPLSKSGPGYPVQLAD